MFINENYTKIIYLYKKITSIASSNIREKQLLNEVHKSKLFKCNHCNYETHRKGDLKKHIRIHTAKNRYKCKYCNYRCSLQWTWCFEKKSCCKMAHEP